MDKKQTFLIVVLTLATLLLTAGSFYQYNHHQVKVNAAVQKAQSQRTAALQELDQSKEAFDLNLESDNNQIKDQGTAITHLCATVIKAKLTDPACH